MNKPTPLTAYISKSASSKISQQEFDDEIRKMKAILLENNVIFDADATVTKVVIPARR